jgi:hypothetical protein
MADLNNRAHAERATSEWSLQTRLTERGFGLLTFPDRYGQICEIQESSLATESCIWLGTGEDRMHLTQAQAAGLIKILTGFVLNGDLRDQLQGGY